MQFGVSQIEKLRNYLAFILSNNKHEDETWRKKIFSAEAAATSIKVNSWNHD